MSVPDILKSVINEKEFECLNKDLQNYLISRCRNKAEMFDREFNKFINAWVSNIGYRSDKAQLLRRKALFTQLSLLNEQQFVHHMIFVSNQAKNNSEFANLTLTERVNLLNQDLPVLITIPGIELNKESIKAHFINRLTANLMQGIVLQNGVANILANNLCTARDNEASIKKKIVHLVDWLEFIPAETFEQLTEGHWDFIFENELAGKYWSHYASLEITDVTENKLVQTALECGLKSTLYQNIMNAFNEYQARTNIKHKKLGMLGYSIIHGKTGITQAEHFIKELDKRYLLPLPEFLARIYTYINKGPGGKRDHSFKTYLENAMKPDEEKQSNSYIM